MSKPSKGLAFSLLTSFLWAMVLVNSRLLLKDGENALNAVLWINGILVLFWIIPFIKHLKEYLALSFHYKALLFLIGITGSVGLNLLQALALQNTSAVNFAFLYRMVVVFTIVLARIFFKERITKSKIFLAVAIILGSYLLTTSGKGFVFTKGDIYTLMMASCAAFIANILIKHTTHKMHPDLSASVIGFVTFLSLFSISLGRHNISVPGNMTLIILGAVISFFQIVTRNRAYKNATASFVTMVVSVTPVIVAVFSFFLLGESLEPIQLFGGLMIVSAGVLVEKLKI